MLASPARKEDRATLKDCYDILGIALNSYHRTENKNLLPHIESQNEFCKQLQNKIDTYDYTEDDARMERVYAFLERVKLT